MGPDTGGYKLGELAILTIDLFFSFDVSWYVV